MSVSQIVVLVVIHLFWYSVRSVKVFRELIQSTNCFNTKNKIIIGTVLLLNC